MATPLSTHWKSRGKWLRFYIQSDLRFMAAHLPKHFSKQPKINRRPRDDKDDESKAVEEAEVPKEMKNALVLIVAISEYVKETKLANLPGAKSDLARYRNLFENEYSFKVLPRNGTKMYRKSSWMQSEILRFIKTERARLFEGYVGDDEKEQGDEKEEQEYDGYI